MLYRTSTPSRLFDTSSVSIRPAKPADAIAIARLAALDSSHSPRGSVLLAEVDGELWAALGVDDGHAVADPFRPSRRALDLLRTRAEQTLGEGRRLQALRPHLAA